MGLNLSYHEVFTLVNKFEDKSKDFTLCVEE